MKKQAGFTITELMISLVILGVLASFALPAYRGYIETTEQGVLRSNMQGIEIFQEDLRMRTGSYGNDLDDLAAITAETGWDPQSDDGTTYEIDLSDGTFYHLEASHPDGLTICTRFPERTPCP